MCEKQAKEQTNKVICESHFLGSGDIHVSARKSMLFAMIAYWYSQIWITWMEREPYTDLIFMPPFEKGGAYCFAPVGRYVGR